MLTLIGITLTLLFISCIETDNKEMRGQYE
jgi:hypothetical protein